MLVLLDLNLPDVSGIDILKRIKENGHLRLAPVVVLTTTDDKSEIQRRYDLGCNVYITKPVDHEKFVNAIQQLGLLMYVMQVPEVAMTDEDHIPAPRVASFKLLAETAQRMAENAESEAARADYLKIAKDWLQRD